MLERIECDSSAESDMSEAEYDFNKASDDCGCCESSQESDIVPSSSSNSTSSLEGVSNSQSLSTSSGVSLLSVLKAPTYLVRGKSPEIYQWERKE